MSTEELITYVLDNVPLEHKPGTKWIYSNFGYQVLGNYTGATEGVVLLLILLASGYLTEHFSGTDYESFVKKSIFAPAGVHDIQVARPSISEKAT